MSVQIQASLSWSARILRQPNAKKTGIKDLDESYAYYVRDDSGQILDRVVAGFKNEGLEDLVSNIKKADHEDFKPKTVKIKKELKDKYVNTFYLPVWLMVESYKEKRRFNYALHIKPRLDFSRLELEDEFMKSLKQSLSEERRERTTFAVTLDDKSRTIHTTKKLSADAEKNINISYMTRRLTEIVENPFLARTLADSCLKAVEEKIGRENLQEHFSFIVSLIVKHLTEEKTRREEQVFLDYVENKKLLLAVSDDETIGYRVPETNTITVSRLPNTFQYYLFEDVELETMNNLEKKVGQILDNQAKRLSNI